MIYDDPYDPAVVEPGTRQKLLKWWDEVEDHYISHQFTRGKITTCSMAKKDKEPMKPEIYYMVHPVLPLDGETVRSNLESAKDYLLWFLQRGAPVAAPWMPYYELFDSKDEEAQYREQCLNYSCAMAQQFAGVICVGKRVSGGMLKEIQAHMNGAQHSKVFDVTGYSSLTEATEALSDILEVVK